MNSLVWPLILQSISQTLLMVLMSGLVAILIGFPLGILLWATRENQLMENPWLNKTLGVVVNIIRSVPFVILMVAIIPFTRFIVGTSIGTGAAIVPLAVCAFPFVARIVENAMNEVGGGLIEASQAMGATSQQIIFKVMVPEALPNIVNGLALMLITLIGYSAMAGAVGGGGLGDLAIRYGYERFELGIMLITVLILVVMVQLIQWIGDYLAKRLAHGNSR